LHDFASVALTTASASATADVGAFHVVDARLPVAQRSRFDPHRRESVTSRSRLAARSAGARRLRGCGHPPCTRRAFERARAPARPGRTAHSGRAELGERRGDRAWRLGVDARLGEQPRDGAAHAAEVGDSLVELREFGRAHRGEVATPYGSLVREGEHLRELGEAEPELLGAAEEPER
jgi:hypothetical protein